MASSPSFSTVATAADDLAAAVRSFQQGHDRETAFRVLFHRFQPALRRFFARKGFPPEDCLDLTQEAWTGIYRGLESFRGDSRLETWIFRIAMTTYLKRLRSQSTGKRQGREVALEPEDGPPAAFRASGGQLEGVLDRERTEALRRAVRELPDQMRRCLTLRLEQDLKYRQIAVILGVSVDTVKAHLFQARQKLRRSLADLADDAFGSEESS